MKRFFKRLYYRIVGERLYLKTLKRGFCGAYHMSLLKNDEIYKWHYFVKKLVKKGDYVLDIGANLGYYTNIFSGLVGKQGKVISVEPIRPFYDVMVSTLKRGNVTSYNRALGNENKTVKMTVPTVDGYLRTGLAHIDNNSGNADSNEHEFEVPMVRGSELFKDLQRLDYLKCDIEGYEDVVLEDMLEVIEELHPLIQVETWGHHKEKVVELLSSIGYRMYVLLDGKLTQNYDEHVYPGDFLFIPKEKEKQVLQSL